MKPLLLAILLCLTACGKSAVGTNGTIRLHPENGHYFEFRGETVVLMGSTEHYGAVMNLDFNYVRYLDEVRACGLNLTRIFTGAYRQYPGFVVEDSPLNVAPGRFIAPWARSNAPGAIDGGNKFNLNQWDPAYFHRLREFVRMAGERGIVVEVTLFCPFYRSIFADDRIWNYSPMKASNHINGVGAGNSDACFQVNSDLLPYHKALTRKIVAELKDCDNVIYEIMNEPYFGAGPGWEEQIISELVAAESGLPQRHLIARNIANVQQTVTNPNSAVSIYNFHYAVPNASLANQGLNRVIGNDETGGVGTADLPYRREAWEFMLSGGGLEDHLDFSFTPTSENGLAAPKQDGGGGPAIRHQLAVLRWCLESLPLVRCAPKTNFITAGVPAGGSVRVLGSDGEAYLLYLRGGTQANLTANLPAGTYRGRWMDPHTCDTTATVATFTHSGGSKIFASPAYVEDAALLLFGGPAAPLEVTLTSPSYQSVAAFDSQLTMTAEVSLAPAEVNRVEFLDNDDVVGVATAPPYSVILTGVAPGNRNLRARLIANDARTATSRGVKCLLTDSFHSGVNLNGAEATVNGHDWTSRVNAEASGMVLTNFTDVSASPTQPLYPTPDPPTKEIVANRIVRVASNQQMTVAYPLANGTYDVFLCLAEGDVGFSRDVRVSLESSVVALGIGNLASHEWVNYGPYRTTVSDGVLNIGLQSETKGNPMIANFSVYHAPPPVVVADATLGLGIAPGVALLSWPASIPPSQVETSATMGQGASWQPLSNPAADFGERWETAMPLVDSQRFFRIRK